MTSINNIIMQFFGLGNREPVVVLARCAINETY